MKKNQKPKNPNASLTMPEVVAKLQELLPDVAPMIQIDRDWIWIPASLTDGREGRPVEIRSVLKQLAFRFKGGDEDHLAGEEEIPCRWAHNCGHRIPSKRKWTKKKAGGGEEKDEQEDLGLDAFGI